MTEEKKFDEIKEVGLEREMKEAYLAYSMSVITARALPDVRDGLKPVHRRIIYAMNELGVYPDKPYRKSAKISGDVMGNYHPHGDMAIYDAMVRLAQDFNIRYPLVDGHGNFGSIDGYGAAASRYTEARMTKLSLELLRDIDKETVDFVPNYDGELTEPTVLPSRYPNLLVNGASGIAVGMATNMAPHNLAESIDAAVKLIDEPEATVEDLMECVKGPDFPTGGNIIGLEGIRSAYRTGRGKIRVRANARIEETARGRQIIVIDEIPYQVNKRSLIEKIVELVRDKKLEGISGINDESDRNGMRIVVEVKRDTSANVVLNNLFKYTQCETTFGVINLALVDGEPKVLNLKELLQYYIDFQREVIVRRTRYDLRKAEARDHIVQGLLLAIDNIDEVIRIIRTSYDDAEAKLIERFGLTEIQAQAILDMRLKRLQGLEKDKLMEEHIKLTQDIARYKEILASSRLVEGIIKTEMLEIKEKYSDARRTNILPDEGEIVMEDIIEEEDVVITLTHFGYIKRTQESQYKSQNRGGKGVSGLTTREEDFVEDIYITSTHDTVLFFTSKGNVFAKKAYEIPEGSRTAKGTAVVNLLTLEPGETIRSMVPISKTTTSKYLMFVTRGGTVKRTELSNFENIRKTGIKAITLKEDDELMAVRLTDGESKIIILTKNGVAMRFQESDVRAMGRTATGVRGVNLGRGDEVIGMELAPDDKFLLTISENGFGKRTQLSEFTAHRRGGKGMRAYGVSDKTGDLIAAKVVNETDDVLLITFSGTVIRLRAKDISVQGRAARGVTLMKMENDRVVAIAKVVDEEEAETTEDQPTKGE